MAALTNASTAVSNVVVGKILHKESGGGVANLLIDAFDVDGWPDPEMSPGTVAHAAAPASMTSPPLDVAAIYKVAERIGSAMTDAHGNFRFDISPKDFNLPRTAEKKPDLVLVVLAPDEPGLDLNKRVLHIARDIRFNAGNEAYIIRFPGALLKERDIPFAANADAALGAAQDRVAAYVADRTRETAFNTGVADYHGAQARQEKQQRKAFRADFIKKVATDLNTVALSGEVAAQGDDIRTKNTQTVNTGIARANGALDVEEGGVPVNLYLTPKDQEDLRPYFAGATGEYVDIPAERLDPILFRVGNTDDPGTLLIHNNPIAAACAGESFEEKCAKEHAGMSHAHETEPAPGAGGTTSVEAITNDDLPTYIGKLVRRMPTPDTVLLADVSKKRADRAQMEKSINEFSLQKGPAEKPAFYDFHVLQIAFDHVWKQLFDESIPDLAYTANTLGKARFGTDDLVGSAFNNGLSLISAFFTFTPVEVPPLVSRFFDITKEEFNEMSFAVRQELQNIANYVAAAGSSATIGQEFGTAGMTVQQLRARQTLIEQGERLIDSVRHDDYYTLHRTLRDLHERMSGTYEFTVFAADKNYHSVNFGVLTTYRQQWTPLAYQAGKLLKSVPLAPREECNYSLKITRNEKRTRREARKNTSSMSREAQSTSRIESDIMARAQNKTNFSLSAEGEYDIGISEGKATSSFGVEALSESAQNRKDFREAVSKAAMAVSQETNSELVTEGADASEFTQSGKISNVNEEVAVNFYFYQVQKRYRISEQLYRVMPVVLVAQEVPSPDQITPAWVISHDWILNRVLLDDSFRPTLHYLANKSVGDDFALRELRKNLRQQRNLVDTLRIEFSAASVEADNRYKALETAITTRIDEEHTERTDGLGHDIWDFFGGNGQDPEAAKARELAAKDAHQYAMDKAEKAAAALRQEVSTLHTLTETYNRTLQERLDNETRVKRLLVHIRNNIFYYMQAIWSMEPPDQRYLRLHKVQVPILELESRSYRVKVGTEKDIFAAFRESGTEKHRAFLSGKLKHDPTQGFRTRSLAEVANLDAPLGFKGNYMIFPLKEHNALTDFMTAPYIDRAFGAMDPDSLANVNLDDYSKYVCCLHEKMKPEDFEAIRPQLKEWLEQLLANPLRNGDEIVVPTDSLFVEALVDQHAMLEDFKLKHRELDVYSVEQDVRRKALENLRLAARLLNDERGDPEIEKTILVEGAPGVVVPADG